MAFLSISIDLCGSTHIKQQLVSIGGHEAFVREALYARYLRLFYQIERDFYELFEQAPELDFSRLYLVKLIGDEFWFVYDLADTDTRQTASSLLMQLLKLQEKERLISFHEKSEDESSSLYTYDLPLKIFVDLISECTEMSGARYEYMKDLVQKYSGRQQGAVYKIDHSFLSVCHQLNFAATEGSDAIFARPDFIGLEVDRFFRLTKFCLPQLLLVGQSLQEILGLKIESLGDERRVLKVQRTEMEGRSLLAVPKLVRSEEMKGISEDYSVLYLFYRELFKDALDAPDIECENMLGDTRAFMAQCGYFAIKEA